MEFDPVGYANEELAPLLRALCVLVQQEQHADQRGFFASVLAGVENASEGEDLADPFMQLSMSAFMGFEFSAAAAMLLDQILAKAQLLTESLALDESQIN